MRNSGVFQKLSVVLAALIFCAVISAFILPLASSLVIASKVEFKSSPTRITAGAEIEHKSFFKSPDTPRIARALRFTLLQALASTLCALCLGLPTAFFTARRNFPLRKFLLSLSGIPLSIPPIIIALAFVLFYGRQGVLNSWLVSLFSLEKPPVTFLYSFFGIVLAHGFYNFPLIMRSVHQVWERLDQDTEDAAALLGAGKVRIFFTITLPSLSSAIFSASILVFLYCFFSFIIVLLFGTIGTTSLEVELYQAARSLLNFSLAGKIALVETLVAFSITLLYAYSLQKLSMARSKLKAPRPRLGLSGIIERSISILFISFIVIFFIGPLISILLKSFEHEGWKALLMRRGFWKAMYNSFSVGVIVACISSTAALFFVVAETLINFKKKNTGENTPVMYRMLPLMPLALSSVMLGFGWTLLVPRGNKLVLIIAQSSIAFPIVWSQIKNVLDAIPQNVQQAGAILSNGKIDQACRLYTPLLKRGIFSGAAFAFAYSVGDATLPLVLSLGSFENLALRLYRLAGSYRFSEACACAVIVGICSSLAFMAQDFGDKK